jgi:hypothetical protein
MFDLKNDFRTALEEHLGHESLLEIVRRYKSAGGGQRQAYDALQSLWIEMGFDEDPHDAENETRDNLEYVMEVVWGFSGRPIWESSLANR